ncbi:MAG: AI-2E family transporter [Planctomycetota bacterium]|nr:AI-2E family transporter [Planctomycetota bacterium]MEC8115117.1 AI-2E family transporter [Planctomycetota bacterium]
MTSFDRKHLWEIQAIRDVLLIAGALSLLWLGYALSSITIPLLMALLLAYLVEPLVEGLGQRGVSRSRAAAWFVGLFGILVVGLLALVLPLIVGQTLRLVDDVESGDMQRRVLRVESILPEQAAAPLQRLAMLLPGEAVLNTESDLVAASGEVESMGPGANSLEMQIQRIVQQELASQSDDAVLQEEGLRAAGAALTSAWSVLVAIVDAGFLLFLIPFYFYFLVLWYPEVIRFGAQLVPRDNREAIFSLLQEMDDVVSGFVRGRLLVSFIMGLMFSVGWWLVGVPYAFVLGMTTGALSTVPFVGGLGAPIAIGLAVLARLELPEIERAAWWMPVVLPAAVFALVSAIEGWVLLPLIAGRATRLDPVTIVVAVLAGGALLGVYGMLLAIPLAACLKILVIRVVLPRLRAWTRGDVADPLPIDDGQ